MADIDKRYQALLFRRNGGDVMAMKAEDAALTKMAGTAKYFTKDEVISATREKHGTPPAKGDCIEFLSDSFTDKGPCTGEVIGCKATVDGYYITLKVGDGQASFSWDDLQPHADKRGNLWMIKALPVLKSATINVDYHGWHGHVRPRPDGMKARCGGPSLCMKCMEEQKTYGQTMAKADPKWEKPTPAQAEAGNYFKPRRKWHGLNLAIENPAGTVREGIDETGTPWRTEFKYAYGEITGTEGVDGDPVDVFIGPYGDAREVYIVRQMKRKKWDQYDEDKCMIDFPSIEAAKNAYCGHYDDARFFGGIVAMPIDEFIMKVKATKDKPAMIKAVLLLRLRS